MGNISLLVPLLFLAMFVQDDEATICYVCSSDLSPSCEDGALNTTDDNAHQDKLVNCDENLGLILAYLQPSKSVCKKRKAMNFRNTQTSPGPPVIRMPVKTVECYACVDCPQVKDQNKTCPFNIDANKMKKCVKYAESYPVENGKILSWIIRGCASDRGSCDEIRKTYSNNSPDLAQLDYCTECEGDRCNSVSRSLPDVVFAFYAVVLTPILAKYTLS